MMVHELTELIEEKLVSFDSFVNNEINRHVDITMATVEITRLRDYEITTVG